MYVAKTAVWLGLAAALVNVAAGVELVRDGQPQAQIVVAREALPQVRTAAGELQYFIEKMSGALLPLVHQPEPDFTHHVYVGASEHSAGLGIVLDDIRYDGFKIIVADNYAVLLGYDQKRPPIPRGYTDTSLSGEMQRQWEAYTRRPWVFPRMLRDPRLYSSEYDFHMFDATGTLHAVYEFLQMLGLRWYMPVEEIGLVIPDLPTIRVDAMELQREPEFGSRYFVFAGLADNPREFLWHKFIGMGGVFDMYPAHSAGAVTRLQQHARPEMIAQRNGRPIKSGREIFLPRLASPELREQLAEYLVMFGDAFPELPDVPIGQPDGWITLDDRDVAAGRLHREREPDGSFSDYHWDFVLDVAERVRARRPHFKFNTLSYAKAKEPPRNVDRIPGDIAIFLAQNGQLQHLRNYADFNRRRDWQEIAPDSDFYIYDYLRPGLVPTIFTGMMQRNFREMPARRKGIYVEMNTSGAKRPHSLRLAHPGTGHLMFYLHGKFTWDCNLDMPALLDEYYEQFYGPAAAEMREFFEFAEEVWMRPEPRRLTAGSGFLKKNDVPKYFAILARARDRAGDTVYGRRIDLIITELQPLKNLF